MKTILSGLKDFKNSENYPFSFSFDDENSGKKQSQGDDANNSSRIDLKGLRELLTGALSIAGKGKNEFVQILCREIGQAVAAVVKEPMTQILKNQKLQITLEIVPKSSTTATRQKHAKSTKKKTKRTPHSKRKSS